MTRLLRTRFRQGDLLRAADLRSDVDRSRRLAALHVRGAHATSGIGLGYAVSGAGSNPTGARVGPGAGFDACGGGIASGRTVFVPAPAEDGTYVLIASEAGWGWRDERRVGHDEVAVAGFALEGGALSLPDLIVRHGARGPGPAWIGAGTTEVSPDWEPETAISVETSGAGFDSTPVYFATIAEDARASAARSDLHGPWLDITDETAEGFTLVVRFAGSRDDLARLGEANVGATVHWVGIERPARCEAPPASSSLVAPGGLRAPTGLFEPAVPDFTDPGGDK
jgi:hypothetical protein